MMRHLVINFYNIISPYRETQDTYELVLVARDHGTPVSFETLRFVTVKIKDVKCFAPKLSLFQDLLFILVDLK